MEEAAGCPVAGAAWAPDSRFFTGQKLDLLLREKCWELKCQPVGCGGASWFCAPQKRATWEEAQGGRVPNPAGP